MNALAVWVMAVCLSACGGSVARPDIAVVGDQSATTFVSKKATLSLLNLDGERVDLESLRGRFVVVNYFARWCAECVEQLPRLNSLIEGANAVDGLQVLAISVDRSPRKAIPKIMATVRPVYPILLADGDTLGGHTPFGKLPALPASYLIGPDGVAEEQLLGAVPLEYIRRRIREISREDQ